MLLKCVPFSGRAHAANDPRDEGASIYSAVPGGTLRTGGPLLRGALCRPANEPRYLVSKGFSGAVEQAAVQVTCLRGNGPLDLTRGRLHARAQLGRQCGRRRKPPPNLRPGPAAHSAAPRQKRELSPRAAKACICKGCQVVSRDFIHSVIGVSHKSKSVGVDSLGGRSYKPLINDGLRPPRRRTTRRLRVFSLS